MCPHGTGALKGPGPPLHPGLGKGRGVPFSPSVTSVPPAPASPTPLPCPMASELTQLEVAIEKLVSAFLSHAGQEGREGSLSPSQFRSLVQLQLPNLMQDVPSLEEKMQELDVNKDQELKFSEYWRLMGELAKAIRREKAGKK